MAVYRLTNRAFSREWRRSKNYREHEIRWLARKRGLETKEHKGALQVIDAKGKVIANFQEVIEREPPQVSERSRLFAALRQ